MRSLGSAHQNRFVAGTTYRWTYSPAKEVIIEGGDLRLLRSSSAEIMRVSDKLYREFGTLLVEKSPQLYQMVCLRACRTCWLHLRGRDPATMDEDRAWYEV